MIKAIKVTDDQFTLIEYVSEYDDIVGDDIIIKRTLGQISLNDLNAVADDLNGQLAQVQMKVDAINEAVENPDAKISTKSLKAEQLGQVKE